MSFTHCFKLTYLLTIVLGVSAFVSAQTATKTSFFSSTADFAPGVTAPASQPLPPLNCPRPTQKYCYWEPTISKDEHYTCWRSWLLYTSSSNSVLYSSTRRWTKTYTISSTVSYSYSTTWNPGVSFSTLCDGHPRAPLDATPTLLTFTTLAPLTTPRVSLEIDPETDYLPWPTKPPCGIPEDKCASLSSAYASMSTSFFGGYYSSNIPLGLWHPPPCTVDYTAYYPQTTCAPASAKSRIACTIFPAALTMLYWPATTSSGGTCGQNGTTITGKPKILGHPNTAVYNGKTFTSPNVYMRIGTARVLQTVIEEQHQMSGWCGSTLHDITMTMKPEDVSKKLWHNGNQLQTQPFNFEDVATISYGAYVDEVCKWGVFRQRASDDCKTVWGGYSPTVLVPTSLTTASMGWEGCDIAQLAQVEEWVPLGDTNGGPRSITATATVV